MTTLTTVGYGDIGGENTAERIFCAMLQIFGTVVFATIMNQVRILKNLDQIDWPRVVKLTTAQTFTAELRAANFSHLSDCDLDTFAQILTVHKNYFNWNKTTTVPPAFYGSWQYELPSAREGVPTYQVPSLFAVWLSCEKTPVFYASWPKILTKQPKTWILESLSQKYNTFIYMYIWMYVYIHVKT